jgi:hypothetical protein
VLTRFTLSIHYSPRFLFSLLISGFVSFDAAFRYSKLPVIFKQPHHTAPPRPPPFQYRMDSHTATPSSIRSASPAAEWRRDLDEIPSYLLMTTGEALEVLHASLRRWKDSGKEGAPRPANSFMLYRKHVNSHLKHAGDTKERQTDASKAIGCGWGRSSLRERAYYGKLAEFVKSEHERLVPGYKYDPKKKRKQCPIDTNQARSPRLETVRRTHLSSPVNPQTNHAFLHCCQS